MKKAEGGQQQVGSRVGSWKIGEQERDLRIGVFEASSPGCGEADGGGRCVQDWRTGNRSSLELDLHWLLSGRHPGACQQ